MVHYYAQIAGARVFARGCGFLNFYLNITRRNDLQFQQTEVQEVLGLEEDILARLLGSELAGSVEDTPRGDGSGQEWGNVLKIGLIENTCAEFIWIYL